jgi:hypothetical protein
MKTLLRRVSTGLYFQSAGRWTSEPADAHNFKSIDRALEFIQTWKLRGVELAFAFTNSKNVKGVPVDETSISFSED